MHERIKLVNDGLVCIVLREGDNQISVVVCSDATVQIQGTHDIRRADHAGLTALQLAISCYLHTGSFAALADTSAVPFPGKRMRVKWSNGSITECDVLSRFREGYWNTSGGGSFATTDLFPLILAKPKYRPYTPVEAAQLMVEERLICDPHGVGLLRWVTKDGVEISFVDYTYQEWLDKCTWRDTGEPCGVKVEDKK